jgi:hypothetical protein
VVHKVSPAPVKNASIALDAVADRILPIKTSERRGQHLREFVKDIPADRLMVENRRALPAAHRVVDARAPSRNELTYLRHRRGAGARPRRSLRKPPRRRNHRRKYGPSAQASSPGWLGVASAAQAHAA